MALVLFKVTLLFALALGCVWSMRRASSATRHLVCACAVAGVLLLPLSLLAPASAAPIRLSAITLLGASGARSGAASMPISKVLIGVWMAGMAILLMRLAIGYGRLAAVLRTATPADGFVFSDVTVPLVAGLFQAGDPDAAFGGNLAVVATRRRSAA